MARVDEPVLAGLARRCPALPTRPAPTRPAPTPVARTSRSSARMPALLSAFSGSPSGSRRRLIGKICLIVYLKRAGRAGECVAGASGCERPCVAAGPCTPTTGMGSRASRASGRRLAEGAGQAQQGAPEDGGVQCHAHAKRGGGARLAVAQAPGRHSSAGRPQDHQPLLRQAGAGAPRGMVCTASVVCNMRPSHQALCAGRPPHPPAWPWPAQTCGARPAASPWRPPRLEADGWGGAGAGVHKDKDLPT